MILRCRRDSRSGWGMAIDVRGFETVFVLRGSEEMSVGVEA